MLTIKSVAKLSLNSVEWDEGKGSVSGFGARRRTGETVAYVLKYRTLDGRQRWHTIGRPARPGRRIWLETRRGGFLARS
jgi:hypothetical protein